MNASIRFLVWGPMPLGAFPDGVLGDWLGVTTTMWVLAGCTLIGALPAAASPLPRMRELPRAHDLLGTDGTAAPP